eukprot:TRINITY_DN67860_c9_g1_i1.p1 TRINITY_DN67860_c9_g1~~TRINITY_DN67860_c9_g1_i1.p1  ORF type:complete len:797 (-),score=93.59 TRINITY_DN67860_c9_g1_i1:126-2516(-)
MAEYASFGFVSGGVRGGTAEEDDRVDKGSDEETDDEQAQPPAPKKRAVTIVLPSKKQKVNDDKDNTQAPKRQPTLGIGSSSSSSSSMSTQPKPQSAAHLQPAFLKGEVGANVMKMMGGMNWTGKGMGKDGKGMSEFIQVKVRTGRVGVGLVAGGEKSDQQKRYEREQRLLRGEEASDDSAEEGMGPSLQQQLHRDERVANAKRTQRRGLWRKDANAEPTKKLSIDDITEKSKSQQHARKEKIIDMRGPQIHILDSAEHITSTPSQHTPKGTLRELRHNISILIEMSQMQMQHLNDQLEIQSGKLKDLEMEQEKVEHCAENNANAIEQLEKISAALEAINTKICQVRHSQFTPGEDPPPINMLSLVRGLQKLRGNFHVAYTAHNIDKLAVSLALPLLKKTVSGWSPSSHPDYCAKEITEWKTFLNGDTTAAKSSILYRNDYNAEGNLYPFLIWEGIFPKIKACIGQWEPHNATSMVSVIEAWRKLLPKLVWNTIQADIMRKLTEAVDEWNPVRSPVPPHQWLHPWLAIPTMPEQLQESNMYRTIRYKIGQALNHWQPAEDTSPMGMIHPWLPVWEQNDTQKFIEQHISGRIGQLIECIQFGKDEEWNNKWEKNIKPWCANGIIPAQKFEQLLTKHFFPRLNTFLRQVLLQQQDDDDVDVMEVYDNWKERISSCVKSTTLNAQWKHTTDVITQSLQNPAAPVQLAFRPLPSSSSSSSGQATAAVLQDDTITVREMLEQEAATMNLIFMPKKGQHHNGKPLHKFGAVTLYIDKDLVYTQEGQQWKPTQFSDLLKRAAGK